MNQPPDSMKTIAGRVREFWRDQGANPRPGATSDEVRSAASRMGVSVPPDIVDFFQTVNGTEGTSGDLFQAWSLDQIGSVPTVLPSFSGIPDYSNIDAALPHAAQYFVFADAMVWSQVMAVRIAPGFATEVVWICGSSFATVAATFQAFWERYLSSPDAVVWAFGANVRSPAG
jgi:hypothetical protein